jgi:DNA-binding phage protein
MMQHLVTEDDGAAYLDAARETGDARLFEVALGDVARACSRMRRVCDTQYADVLPADSWHEA